MEKILRINLSNGQSSTENVSDEDLEKESWKQAGERIFNMKRAYNMDCGMTNEEDKIGSRFLTPIPKGATRKNVPPIEDLLPYYYKIRGWDSNGCPTLNS